MNFAKRMAIVLFFLTTLGLSSAWAATTGKITFGNGGTSISSASVTGTDNLGNTWKITTTGTNAFPSNNVYAQVGTSSDPAASITFTMTLPAAQRITDFSATFGGFGSTDGSITLKVGNQTIGSDVLNTVYDVVVSNTSEASGTVLTVSVNNITGGGVKCYEISYTYESTTTHEVTWIADDIEVKKESIAEGTIAMSQLPADPDDCTPEVVFVGWTANPNVDGDRPLDLFNGNLSYKLPNITEPQTFYAVYATQIEPAGIKTDNMTRETTGVANQTGSASYSDWSVKSLTSPAEYKGNSAGMNNSIHLRDKSASGIITSKSGGKAKKVVIVWNSNTREDAELKIYGKNQAYSSTSELYDTNTQGTLIGTIDRNSTTLDIADDYEYIGMSSLTGAIYLTSISITWESEGSFENYTTTCSVDVTVTLNPNGGTGGDYADWIQEGNKYTQTVEKGNSVTLPTLDDQTAYTFGGWSDGTTTHVAGSYTPEEDVELIAIWNPKPLKDYRTLCTYDILLDKNNTDADSFDGSATVTSTYTLLENITAPTRTGYTIEGYYAEEECITKVASVDGTLQSGVAGYTDADGKWIAEDIQVLYTKWTANQYTITFDQQGGQGGTESVEATYGNKLPDITIPTREGYSFGGYFTEADGAGTQYYNIEGTAYRNMIWNETAPRTLYAKWTAHTYVVKFNANGGSGVMDDQTFTYDQAQPLSANAFTRTGYTFTTWNDKANGTGTSYADKQSVINLTSAKGGQKTIYAQWTANTNTPYVVEHYQEALDGGYTLVETDALTGTTDAEVTPGTKTYEGFTAPATQTVTIWADGSLIVKYQYTRNSYQLTWDLNGGNETIAGTPEGSVKYGAPLTAPTVEKTGYTFAGWDPAVPATMPAEDQTFKAIWENCRWVETDIDDIEYGDDVLITVPGIDANGVAILNMMQDPHAATNPTIETMNVSDLLNGANVDATLIWNIRKRDDNQDNFTIYRNGSTTERLAFITNYGVRVGGNNADSIFTLTPEKYLKSIATQEYLRMATSDWRHYSTNTTQTLKFYKRICLDDTKHWVTWDANGGLFADGSATKTDFFTVGATITHPANPTREGYTFTGWAPMTNTMPNEDIALVAQWQVNSYTVTWNANGGKFGNETSVEQSYPYGAPIIAPTPTRTGYTFAGWDSEVPATMPANNVTYTAQWTCTSPTDIKINGEYIRFPGETIELTVTGNNIADDATYTWKKGDQVIEGQTTATLTIPNCVVGDACNYVCEVSNGGCVATNNFTVKMYRLRGLTDSSWNTDYVFSKSAENVKEATYSIELSGNSSYPFKVFDGSAYYGNNEGGDNTTPTMKHDNCTDWVMQENKGYNVTLQTTMTGVYTFILDYNDESNPKISVIYPSKKIVYLNPGDWTSPKFAVYAWNGNTNTNKTYLMTKVDDCTDRNIYQAEIDATYNNVIFIGGNASYNVSNPWTNVEHQTIDLTYPSDDKVLYELNTTHLFLKPNNNWKSADARFAAYFFDNGETWVSMTKVNDDLYKVPIPTNKVYPSVIFCRMNGGTTANNWNNRWNQSSNLTITKGKNHYTISDGVWDNVGGTWKTAGEWTDFIPFHTISYNMNGHGTQISDDCIEDGNAWSAPTDPTEVGYTFEGWRRPATTGDNTLYKNGQAGFTPTANEELTAQWTFAMEYDITNAEPVFITSAVGQTIKGTTPLTLAVSNMPVGTEINISAPNITFYDGAGVVVTELTTNSNPEEFNLTAAYTPTAENTTEQPTITLDVLDHEKVIDDKISCRSLPVTFAIVAKVGNLWYALPSQGLNSTDDLVGYPIEVDNQDDPTTVTSVPTNADWSLKQVYAASHSDATKDRFKLNGHNLVFVNNEATPKALNASNSGNYLLTDAQYDGYQGAQIPGMYEWTPATADLETYTLTNANPTTGRDIMLSMNITNIFGVHKQNVATSELRFLPIQEPRYTQAVLQVVEWKENSVVVMYTGDPTQTATLAINGTEQIGTTTLNTVQKDIAIYELPASGIANKATQRLCIAIGGSKKWLTVPYIISSNTSDVDLLLTTSTTKALAALTDVVILDGNTFTAAGTKNNKYSFRNVTVYGGGKLVIPATASEGLGIYSLIMRIGTVNSDGSYTNSYPQLVMNGKYTNTSGISLDYITTYERYYALSVPYVVETKDIKYPAEIYGDNLKTGNKASFALQEYDGAKRATGATGWKDFDESGDAPQLTPYKGYTFWGAPRKVSVNGGEAQRPKYGIHRIPLTGVGADDLYNSENAASKQIDITAYPAERPNDMGWNFLGNPYLAQYGGWNATADEDIQVGLLEKEMVDEKWTGGYTHEGDLRYVTFTNDGQNYWSEEVNKATFHPFNTFFIQAFATGKLEFALSGRAQNAPARRYAAQQEATEEITTGILLTGNDQTDRTGLLIADNFTEEYDFNADLSKFTNQGINLYTIGKDGNLAFMAINQSLAEQPIPLGYGAPADGEYIFAFDDERYEANDISALYLFDYDRNETTNLLHTDYSFTTAAGTYNERFALQVAFIPENATNIELTEDATIQMAIEGNNLWLNNLPTDATITIYDAVGHTITHTSATQNEMQFTLPTGYYLIRIANKQEAVVIDTVIP